MTRKMPDTERLTESFDTKAAIRELMGWMAPSRHLRAKMVSVESHHEQEPSMSEITTIGLDLAKSVFQVHGVNEAGGGVTRKRLRRGQMLIFFAGLPPCLVGMEALCNGALLGARTESAGT